MNEINQKPIYKYFINKIKNYHDYFGHVLWERWQFEHSKKTWF